MMSPALAFVFTSLVVLQQPAGVRADDNQTAQTAIKEDSGGWQPLFSGKDLKHWKVTEFGGQGQVRVDDNGDVVIHEGVDLSGIASTRQDLPTTQYEVEFEAQRESGTDFFAGFTFPVGDSFCSLILGGWGGGVCGLSSLDFMDASENETTSYTSFIQGQWYKVHVRVTDRFIQAWLDGKRIVKVERQLYRIDVRFEMESSKPMGFATYQTVGRIRSARLRTLPAVNP